MRLGVYVPLFLVTLAEASIGIFVKLVGDDVPVYTLNFYRVLFAAALLAAALPFFNKKFWHWPKGNVRDTFIIGLLIAAQISFFTLAMTLTTVASAVIFWSVAPFFVFIFSWLFLGEPAKKQHILIFAVALVGLVIANPLGGGNALGNAIALFDGVIYAAMVTYMRHEGKTEESNDIFWFMVAATLILLPGILIFGPGALFAASGNALFGLTVPVIVWVACLGVLSTGVAYLFISVVLKKLNANVYSLVDIIVSPIVAAVLAYFVFGEVPSTGVMIGGGLLLASGAWLTRNMAIGQQKNLEKVPVSVK